jgi:hypothetical protein
VFGTFHKPLKLEPLTENASSDGRRSEGERNSVEEESAADSFSEESDRRPRFTDEDDESLKHGNEGKTSFENDPSPDQLQSGSEKTRIAAAPRHHLNKRAKRSTPWQQDATFPTRSAQRQHFAQFKSNTVGEESKEVAVSVSGTDHNTTQGNGISHTGAGLSTLIDSGLRPTEDQRNPVDMEMVNPHPSSTDPNEYLAQALMDELVRLQFDSDADEDVPKYPNTRATPASHSENNVKNSSPPGQSFNNDVGLLTDIKALPYEDDSNMTGRQTLFGESQFLRANIFQSFLQNVVRQAFEDLAEEAEHLSEQPSTPLGTLDHAVAQDGKASQDNRKTLPQEGTEGSQLVGKLLGNVHIHARAHTHTNTRPRAQTHTHTHTDTHTHTRTHTKASPTHTYRERK